jgi:hypothetical protein
MESAPDAEAASADDDGMPAHVIQKIDEINAALSKQRKKRVSKPEGLATSEELGALKEASDTHFACFCMLL